MLPLKFLTCLLLTGDSESEDSDSRGHDYTNIRIDTEGLTVEDTEVKPYEANALNNGAAIEIVRFTFVLSLDSVVDCLHLCSRPL